MDEGKDQMHTHGQIISYTFNQQNSLSKLKNLIAYVNDKHMYV